MRCTFYTLDTFCILQIIHKSSNSKKYISFIPFYTECFLFVAAKNENIHTHIQKFFMILSGAECSIEKPRLGCAGLAGLGWLAGCGWVGGRVIFINGDTPAITGQPPHTLLSAKQPRQIDTNISSRTPEIEHYCGRASIRIVKEASAGAGIELVTR